jgi:hypothetical protein
MKESIFGLFCFVSGLTFSQVSKDSNEVIQLGYNPIELGNQTADCIKKMSSEEKEWFKSTFFHKKRQFKIPENPIVDPFEENNKNK